MSLKPKELEAAPSTRKERKSTRRQFLQTAAGAAAAMAGSSVAAWGNNHPHPSPQSITYLDRRM